MKENILDIFYNHIVPEASNGKIDCFMYYHICFNSLIEGSLIEGNCPEYIDAPLLEIRDKKKFNELLIEYVKLALDFYDDHYFYEEVLSGEYRTSANEICKEKVLMTLLWGNATIEDFQDPCRFLIRQKSYLENNFLTEKKDLGYSKVLSGNIVTEVLKTGKLSWESPYSFYSAVFNESDTHDLPTVRFGIEDDIVYVYSVHQEKNSRKSKKINRSLYKVNENFDSLGEANSLKDVTPSFLVALTLFILHFQQLGYKNFKIVQYLPERWIDKKIMIHKKALKSGQKTATYKENMNKLVYIQENLVQKICTTLLRLQYHYGDNITIKSFPFETDSYLTFSCGTLSYSNNELFQELSVLHRSDEKKLH